MLERISEVLFHGKSHVVKSDFDRPNIHYYVQNAYAKKRAAFRLAVLEQKPLIIFCGTRAKSEDMARELSEYLGRDKVRFYHAGLEREEKTAVEKWFYDKTDAVLCCTVAFGMGVDKKDIHTVIHLEPSSSIRSWKKCLSLHLTATRTNCTFLPWMYLKPTQAEQGIRYTEPLFFGGDN